MSTQEGAVIPNEQIGEVGATIQQAEAEREYASQPCDCAKCRGGRQFHWGCAVCGQRYDFTQRGPHFRRIHMDPAAVAGRADYCCSEYCQHQYESVRPSRLSPPIRVAGERPASD